MISIFHEPLTQVVFVHDYLQLIFQDDSLTIYNRPTISTSEVTIGWKQQGFCDALVALIGQRVTHVSEDEPLRLTFERGDVVSVTSVGNGPEAFQYSCSVGLVVEQNKPAPRTNSP